MLKNLKRNEIAVLLEISNLPANGCNYFKLDKEDYTLFKTEKEVLIKDGL